MKKSSSAQNRGKARSGGGATSNKLRQVPVRTGPPRTDKVSVAATGMLGQSINFQRPELIKGTAPQVPSGNDVAASTVCGPGGSRTIYKSGFQALTGKPSPGEGKIGPSAGKDILSEYGPDKRRG
jgi:hypothetical protein